MIDQATREHVLQEAFADLDTLIAHLEDDHECSTGIETWNARALDLLHIEKHR